MRSERIQSEFESPVAYQPSLLRSFGWQARLKKAARHSLGEGGLDKALSSEEERRSYKPKVEIS